MSVDLTQIEAAIREFALGKSLSIRDRFVETLRQHMPRRTGGLAESVEAGEPEERGGGWSTRVDVTAEYARYVNDGTGRYGPQGHDLEADELTAPMKNGQHRFVFDWPAAGGIVFAKTVKGTEPTHFWERTIERWDEIVGGA